MGNSPVSALTNLAVEAFRAGGVSPTQDGFRNGFLGDPVLDGAPELFTYFPGIFGSDATAEASESLSHDPALTELLPRDGENDPVFTSAGSSTQIQFDMIPYGLVTSALRLMYFRSLDATEGGLASLVIENYEELKRVLRGEEIRTHTIYGLTGVQLPKGMQITTPWGIVKSAPVPNPHNAMATAMAWRATTTAVLVRQRLTKIEISRDGMPEWSGGRDEHFEGERRIHELLPLAFALATDDKTRCAPTITFATTIDPFSGSWGTSFIHRPPSMGEPVEIGPDQVSSIEEWARRLNNGHVEGLQVAAKRIVSAIADRHDKADALIDAVTVWETLVGTRAETVFRVTAALAKLLEMDPAERGAFRKTLSDVYDTRSRVIHGDLVDPVLLAERAGTAIDVALAATRAIYERGGEWLMLKSTARADRLILGD